jgi:peptide/nickel transport system substrate-binding protein
MNIKKLLLSLLMFSLIAVSACSPAVTPAPTEDTAQTAPTEVSQPAATDEVAEEPTAAAEPVEYKKEITAVVIVEPKSMDPIYGDAPGSDLYTYNLFYDNLIELVDGEYVPSMAESYTISDDYQDLVFKLRQGVKFHDGTDFNAEAVKWNLERVKNTADSYYVNEVQVISDVIVVDDYTVEIKLSEPNAPILSTLASNPGCMVSPAAFEKYGEDYHRNPVGTGPYKFVSWTGGERVVGERFADYWKKDADGVQLPYSDKVTVRFISEPAVALIELQSGNIDLMEDNIPQDFETVKSDPNLQIIPSGAGIHQWMAFNTTAEPFSNEKLRQAFSAAIDRQTLMEVISLGYGEVTPTLVPPGEWIYNADVQNPYAYDPEKAKSLLAEAGYPDGIEVTMSVIQRDPDVQIAELMQAQVAEVGITMNVEVLERQAWIDKVTSQNFELAMLRITVPRPDPNQVFEPSFGSADGSQNWSSFDDPEIFDLVANAKKELNQETRYEYYTEVQQLLLDHAYFAFLFLRPQMTLTSSAVEEVSFDLSGSWRLGETKVLSK